VNEIPEYILGRITDHYLASEDFNGLPGRELLAAAAHADSSIPVAVRASTETERLASRRASGVVRDHASGSAFATIPGSNPAKHAMTGSAPTAPSGAARNAK
jgi:hypothetical protein